jgi:signal peptidase I
LLRDYGGTIVIAVIVALLIRFFLIEAYRIPSAAMRPTLEPGDTIFVAKWPFGLRFPWMTNSTLTQPRAPDHGEVVVFSLEKEQRRDYIKRVLGLPGDTVEIREGRFYLNGESREVPGSRRGNCEQESTPDQKIYSVCREAPLVKNFGPEKVPPGSMFVIGDMRTQRPKETGIFKEFRSWGIVPASTLKGSALWIWLSVDPDARGTANGWFPSFRFDRMFRRLQ